MATRAAFLSDATHRLRFVYTLKHSSWMNQVEIWFSILVRRLLKRSSFTSLDDLCCRILAFSDYNNRTMAKVWGREYTEEIDYLRVYVRGLRRKLGEDPEQPEYILTARGVGYRFRGAS